MLDIDAISKPIPEAVRMYGSKLVSINNSVKSQTRTCVHSILIAATAV